MIYYFPNRPTLVPPDPQNPLDPKPDYINSLEASGKYIAEQKWNGDNVLVYTTGMEFWTRHKTKHRYSPSPQMLAELKKWPKGCILNAELLHYKTKNIKDTLIVHCLMAWKGRYLIGKRWSDSRAILDQAPAGQAVQISPVWKSGFWKLFQEADGATIEGIILKNPTGKLRFSATPISDVSWMLKIRKPSKKAPF